MILVALGLFGLAWGGFTYTTRENSLETDSRHTGKDTERSSHLWRGGAHWRRCPARGGQKGIRPAQPSLAGKSEERSALSREIRRHLRSMPNRRIRSSFPRSLRRPIGGGPL